MERNCRTAEEGKPWLERYLNRPEMKGGEEMEEGEGPPRKESEVGEGKKEKSMSGLLAPAPEKGTHR